MELALDRDRLAEAASAGAQLAIEAVANWRRDSLPARGWAGGDAERVVHEGESSGHWTVGSREAWERGQNAAGDVSARPMRVCLRKRPLAEKEAAALGTADSRRVKCFDAVSISSPGAFFHEWQDSNDVMTLKRLTESGGLLTRCYGPFDHAFDGSDDTDAVYKTAVCDLVPFVLLGGTATCIAYGQTGAGKTFTMTGLQDRLAHDLFAAAAGRSIRMAFIENQGDRCYDLQNKRAKVSLREDADGAVHVAGLKESAVSTLEALREALAAANLLRASAPTQTHPHSSRSHAILSLRIDGVDGTPGGLLRVVDLAGSERHESASAHSMERIAEMRDINSSLSSLKDCIRAQHDAPAAAAGGLPVHIPYRRSKLTMLLKECFTAFDARTIFIAHVAPLAACTQYTKSTLDYCMQLLAVAERRAKEKLQQLDDVERKGWRTDPSKWSRARVRKWLETVDNGRFAFAVEHIPLDGMSMRHTPTSGEFGFDTRLGLAGVSDEKKLAEGQRLGDLFAKELRDYAESKRSPTSGNGKCSKDGNKTKGMVAQPISAEVMGEMMAYYKVYNLKFANPMKISRICRSFQAKARAATASLGAEDHVSDSVQESNDAKHGEVEDSVESEPEASDPEAWVEMMYAALAEKNGGVGPRDILRSRSSSTALCGYIPVETTKVDATPPKRAAKQANQCGCIPLQEVNGQSG